VKTGDLILAGNIGSTKVHIVRLRDQPYPDETESPSGGSGRSGLWDGSSLCRTRNRYYWHAITGGMVEDKEQCRACFSRWRAMDRPPVPGLSDGGMKPIERQPPTAWREVPATGLLKDSKPKDDDSDNKRPVHELRRWVRGARYVRLVEVLGDSTYKYGVHTGIVGDEEKTDSWTTRSTEAACLQRAWEIMAAGGGSF